MAAEAITSGPWGIMVKVRDCLCTDGRRRVATITGQPDTFFSVPARVKVRGKTVSGYVTGMEGERSEPDFKFIAYSYRKNGHLLPGI